MPYKLGIIGGGTMGHAILAGAIRAGVLLPSDIFVADLDAIRRQQAAELGCRVGEKITDVDSCEQIMLAVKPQSFTAESKSLLKLSRPTVIISIMAGLSSDRLRQALGKQARIVRAMPNTPCCLGAGVTGIALGAGAEPGDESLAVRLFEALGVVVRVKESLLHAVTAVSGSGPAYVFSLAESMEKAAHSLGLTPAQARVFVAHTIAGAGKMLLQNEADPQKLRQKVTSKKGTTAAALQVMQEQGFEDLILNAIQAARDRGIELDNQ